MHRLLYEQHIKGTPEKALVADKKALVCHLSKSVKNDLGFDPGKVYINTKVLKHLYDKRPAEEFDCIVTNLKSIVKHPDSIYENKDSKRAGLCLVKQINNTDYIVCIETLEDNEIIIVTSFRIRKASYLKDYKLLWSWRGGNPSS